VLVDIGFQRKGVLYVFTVLPFGLSSACYLFTKFFWSLLCFLRVRGLKVIGYLDDGIVAVRGKERTMRKNASGFVVSLEKIPITLNGYRQVPH